MKHFNIIVTGRVQGVFYRQSAYEAANQLGIHGFVRNEKNGNVYIEAEGTEEELNKFIQWCKKGPPRAVVLEINISESGLQKFLSFNIRR